MNIKIVIVSVILVNYLSGIVVAHSGSECNSDLEEYKPHPSICALFFQCSSNGTYVLHTCPGYLHFNPILNVCDYPHLAGCLNGDVTTSTTRDPTPTESTAVPGTSTTSTDKCNDGEYLIHEQECEAFYRCIAGRFILIYCPNDMQFNLTSKTCEFEEFACNEEKQITITTEITTTVGSTQMCANNEYQPDRSDCEAFYRCVNGHFILLFCPMGMHFNQNTRQCDSPEVAGCQSMELASEEKCSNGESQSHPNDCEAFYRCMNGELLLLYCPVGMHFNGSTRRCGLPQSAGCSYVSK